MKVKINFLLKKIKNCYCWLSNYSQSWCCFIAGLDFFVAYLRGGMKISREVGIISAIMLPGFLVPYSKYFGFSATEKLDSEAFALFIEGLVNLVTQNASLQTLETYIVENGGEITVLNLIELLKEYANSPLCEAYKKIPISQYIINLIDISDNPAWTMPVKEVSMTIGHKISEWLIGLTDIMPKEGGLSMPFVIGVGIAFVAVCVWLDKSADFPPESAMKLKDVSVVQIPSESLQYSAFETFDFLNKVYSSWYLFLFFLLLFLRRKY